MSGVFGSQRILNGEPKSPHFGVDVANKEGTPIYAPTAGIVSLAEDFYLNGDSPFWTMDRACRLVTCIRASAS